MGVSGGRSLAIGLIGTRERTVASLGAMLEAGGYEVRLASRGDVSETLRELQASCSAVVVEAIEATALSDALEKLAGQGQGGGIVTVTDAREVGLRVRLVEAGVGDVVARPLAGAELLARLARVCARVVPELRGALRVAGLSEVLMLLHQQRASGELQVRAERLTATVWLWRGVLLGARASRGLWGEKALFRVLRVVEEAAGVFEFYEGDPGPADLGGAQFDPLPTLILRAAQHADEFRALRAHLPSGPLRLVSALTYNERCAEVSRLLQRNLLRSWSVDALIDASPLLDLEIARQLHEALTLHEVCCDPPPRHDPAGC
ncbi:response regulator [Bradymonadaceae bacterium TMQ3]|nr:response regulator [Bradymonadaceae bacterium TMQ3]TXC77280.1 response regulator [Bradymonadales bacterium TMQ1]